MKHLAPTLAALAIAAAPVIGAEDFTVKVGGIVQARALLGNYAENANGDNYDMLRSQNGNAEYARFGIRRARIAMSAKTSDGWYGNVTVRAGEPNNLAGTADASSAVQLYYAYVGRTFKTGDIEHEIKLGLDKSFNNESAISSSTLIFPSDRVTGNVSDSFGARSPGVAYRLNHEYVRFGVDLQNNTTSQNGPISGTSAATSGAEANKQNGVRTSARIEGGLLPAKKQESFAGTPGHHLVFGFEAARNGDAYTTAQTVAGTSSRTTTFIVGPDFQYHLDGLSFLAEYRLRTQDVTAITPATTDTVRKEARYLSATAAYAVPLEAGMVVEPGLRVQRADQISGDPAVAENSAASKSADLYPNGEFGKDGGVSGTEWGVVVNTYWNGHKNKTQVAFNQARALNDQGLARFVTIQHQVLF